jgi:hypothetical protein
MALARCPFPVFGQADAAAYIFPHLCRPINTLFFLTPLKL